MLMVGGQGHATFRDVQRYRDPLAKGIEAEGEIR